MNEVVAPIYQAGNLKDLWRILDQQHRALTQEAVKLGWNRKRSLPIRERLRALQIECSKASLAYWHCASQNASNDPLSAQVKVSHAKISA